ncbi:MAG: CDP-alcohol phosphatidyltransferase family protein [Anaerolineae bacterium]
MRQFWSVTETLSWAGVAGMVLLLQLFLLRRHLASNYRPGGPTRPILADLGWGNVVTLSRGLAIAAFAGFLVAPLPLDGRLAWAPAILYALGVLPDFLDGMLARAAGRVTVLGGILDMEYDALAMLAASALAVRLGKVPVWYVALGLARYLFVAGLWLRRRRGLPVFELPPSNTRRLAAGFQMIFFCVAFWPIFGPPFTTLAGTLVAAPVLLGFGRDWLIVSGQISLASPLYGRFQQWRRALWVWALPFLRVAAAGTALAALAPALWLANSEDPTGWVRHVLLVATLVAATGLWLGAGTRLSAIGILIPLCVAVAWNGFQPYHGVLLCTTIPLLYTGGGALALWRGEDDLFQRRIGEKRHAAPVAQGRKQM